MADEDPLTVDVSDSMRLSELLSRETQNIRHQQRTQGRFRVRPGPGRPPDAVLLMSGGGGGGGGGKPTAASSSSSGAASAPTSAKGKVDRLRAETAAFSRRQRPDEELVALKEEAHREVLGAGGNVRVGLQAWHLRKDVYRLQQAYNQRRFQTDAAKQRLEELRLQHRDLELQDDVDAHKEKAFAAIDSLAAQIDKRRLRIYKTETYGQTLLHMKSRLHLQRHTYDNTLEVFREAQEMHREQTNDVSIMVSAVRQEKEQEERELARLQEDYTQMVIDWQQRIRERRRQLLEREAMQRWQEERRRRDEEAESGGKSVKDVTEAYLMARRSSLLVKTGATSTQQLLRQLESGFSQIWEAASLGGEYAAEAAANERIIEQYQSMDTRIRDCEALYEDAVAHLETTRKRHALLQDKLEATKEAVDKDAEVFPSAQLDALREERDRHLAETKRATERATQVDALLRSVDQVVAQLIKQLSGVQLDPSQVPHHDVPLAENVLLIGRKLHRLGRLANIEYEGLAAFSPKRTRGGKRRDLRRRGAILGSSGASRRSSTGVAPSSTQTAASQSATDEAAAEEEKQKEKEPPKGHVGFGVTANSMAPPVKFNVRVPTVSSGAPGTNYSGAGGLSTLRPHSALRSGDFFRKKLKEDAERVRPKRLLMRRPSRTASLPDEEDDEGAIGNDANMEEQQGVLTFNALLKVAYKQRPKTAGAGRSRRGPGGGVAFHTGRVIDVSGRGGAEAALARSRRARGEPPMSPSKRKAKKKAEEEEERNALPGGVLAAETRRKILNAVLSRESLKKSSQAIYDTAAKKFDKKRRIRHKHAAEIIAEMMLEEPTPAPIPE